MLTISSQLGSFSLFYSCQYWSFWRRETPMRSMAFLLQQPP